MSLRVGQHIERYEVLGVLGQGGSARVYKVRHLSLGTLHALKVMQGAQLQKESQQRMLREARIQAALQHPNLVPVSDLLEVEGKPALLMEYVPGPDLAALLRTAKLSPSEVTRVFSELLAGLAHAHSLGVVHRDIKASNVLMDTRHRPPRARLTDFGVARDGQGGLTGDAAWLGTLDSMSPEQLRGEAGAHPSSDVYALGLLLYELLSGAPAFDSPDPIARIQAMEQGQWRPPPGPPELLQVLSACLEPDPKRRPQSAGALLTLLGGQAPERPPQAPARPRLGVGLLLSAGAAAVVAAAWILPRPTLQDTQSTERALRLRLLASEEPLGGKRLALLRAASALEGKPGIEERELATLLAQGAQAHWFGLHGSPILGVALTERWLLAVDREGLLRAWERESGERVSTVETHLHQPRDLRVEPQGRWFTVMPHPTLGQATGVAVAWNLPDGEVRLSLPGKVRAGVSSQDAQLLSAHLVGEHERLGVWDVDSGQALLLLARDTELVNLHPSQDGEHLILNFQDYIEVREVAHPQAPGRVLDSPGLVLSPDTYRALIPEEQGLRLMELQAKDSDRVRSWQPTEMSLAPAFSRDAEQLLLVTESSVKLLPWRDGVGVTTQLSGVILQEQAGQSAFVLGTRSGEAVYMQPGHPPQRWSHHLSRISSLMVLQDTLASADISGSVSVSPIQSGAQGAKSVGIQAMGTPTWLIDGEPLTQVLGGLWDTQGLIAALPPDTLQLRRHGERWLSLSPSGLFLGEQRLMELPGSVKLHPIRVGATARGLALAQGGSLWTGTEAGMHPRTIEVDQITALQPLDSGNIAVGQGSRAVVSIVDPAKGEVLRTLGHSLPPLRGVASMAAQGEWIWVGTWRGEILGWTESGGAPIVLPGHSEGTQMLTVGQDRLLSWGGDGTLTLWDTRSSEALKRLPLDEIPSAMAWSSEHQVFAVCTRSGTLLLISAQGELLAARQLPGWVSALYFLPEHLRTLDRNGRAVDWDLSVLLSDQSSLAASGRLNNLRVCPESFQVVAVLPYPQPETVWAPERDCE